MDKITQLKLRLQALSSETAALAKLMALSQEYQQLSFEMAKVLDEQETELAKYRPVLTLPGRGAGTPQTPRASPAGRSR